MIVTFWLELLMGACYLTGAYIYAVAVPEKWKPGRFDVWMSSHNIFHILVVMGAYVHYRAALVLLAWWGPLCTSCTEAIFAPENKDPKLNAEKNNLSLGGGNQTQKQLEHSKLHP
jgi:hypothetical protein